MPPLHESSDATASFLASVEYAAALEIAGASDMRVRGTVLMAFRHAAIASWGEDGLREVGTLLSEPTRRLTVDVAADSLDWIPELYVLEWYNALWHGPCCRRRELFLKFLNRMIDAGFGRVRKTLVALASPATVLNKAPSLWQHDHSHGALKLVALERDSAKVSLTAHPYTETSLARLATAEIYRYCLALCRVHDVVEVHYREPDGTLIVPALDRLAAPNRRWRGHSWSRRCEARATAAGVVKKHAGPAASGPRCTCAPHRARHKQTQQRGAVCASRRAELAEGCYVTDSAATVTTLSPRSRQDPLTSRDLGNEHAIA